MEEKLKSLISFAEATQKLKDLFLEELSNSETLDDEIDDEISALLDHIINGEITKTEALEKFRNLGFENPSDDPIAHSVTVKVDSFNQCTLSVPVYPANTSLDITYYLADYGTPVIDISHIDIEGYSKSLAVLEQKRGELAVIDGLESLNEVLDLYIYNNPEHDDWTDKYRFD